MDRITPIMKRHLTFTLVLVALLVGACGPSEADIQATVAIAQSNAVQTVYAQFTQIALLTPSATNTLPPTATPAATNTPLVTPTSGLSGATGCDVMQFVGDATIPDNTEVAANTTFTKTWQVKNSGTCDWTTSYKLMFSNGDQMGGPSSQTLTATIAAGASGNISITLVAPSTSGTYTGWWALANASGQVIKDGYLSVIIKVP